MRRRRPGCGAEVRSLTQFLMNRFVGGESEGEVWCGLSREEAPPKMLPLLGQRQQVPCLLVLRNVLAA